MSTRKMEWGKEVVQAGSDIANLTSAIGIPGIGLVALFVQKFYDNYLQGRFQRFIADAEIDEELIKKIADDENYSNCLYAILETVRQTHSRIGLAALALIYKDRWNDNYFLIAATRSFSQISDKTIEAFITLFESISAEQNYLVLWVQKDDLSHFHDLYNEAVELISRNFFVMSTGAGMHANGPFQCMKWAHTEVYYNYCKIAKCRF